MILPFQVSALAKLKVLKESVTHIAGGRWPLHLVVIAVLGLLAYSNTFNVPFQWDDKYTFLLENPIVKDLSYFLEPSEAKGHELYTAFRSRYIGYLTFALNYKIHGTDVTGYHVFNITIHILNALLVYLLVILTFRTPFLKESSLKEHAGYIALFTALLFVSHPIQTEAVTYIFQRLASLMAFFYLLSLVAYVGSRLSTGKSARYTLYTVSLVSAVLAMKTKENAFTLPIVIALYEVSLWSKTAFLQTLDRRIDFKIKEVFNFSRIKKTVCPLIPFFLTMFIIPLTLLGTDKPAREMIIRIEPTVSDYVGIPGKDYLFTQFRVIVTYIRLLFLPVNQNLDYDYPVFHSFLNPQVFLSFLFLSAIFGGAIYLFHRSRFTGPDLRLVSVGILWFFITLSVESGIISIPMVINEYRVYLPSVGFFMASMTAAFLLLGKFKNREVRTIAVSFLVLIPLVLSIATYARNTVWGSEISLWEDVVRKSPEKERGHNNLGLAYASEGLMDKAIEHYRTAIEIDPYYAEAYDNLGNAYASKGLLDKAVMYRQTALRFNQDSAEAHNNLGTTYVSEGLYDKAIEQYQLALKLKPDNAEIHYNLGTVYGTKGLYDKAIKHSKIAVKLKPDHAKAHNNLGNAYLYKGLIDKAITHYLTAVKIEPDYAKAHYNLSMAYARKGLTGRANKHFQKARSLESE